MRLIRARSDRQGESEEDEGGQEVAGQIPGVNRGMPGDGGGDGEREPEDDVFEHGDSENESGEACVLDFEVEEDLRDDGNGGNGDGDGEDDGE